MLRERVEQYNRKRTLEVAVFTMRRAATEDSVVVHAAPDDPKKMLLALLEPLAYLRSCLVERKWLAKKLALRIPAKRPIVQSSLAIGMAVRRWDARCELLPVEMVADRVRCASRAPHRRLKARH
jgi:hypothetical protein